MPSTQNDGLNISYRDTGGEGAPVVLIHGFPFNGSMWDPQVEALGERWRLIVPDLRGFGASDAPEERSRYTVDSFASDVRAVLDDTGVDKAVVCGLSMGGYVAFAFLRSYGERAAGLVLANTRAESDPPEGIEKRTGQQRQVESEGISALVEAMPNALTAEKSRSNDPALVDRVRAVMDNPAPGYIGALEAMKQRPDVTADLSGISVPTLVITGADDPLIPPDASRSMHEAISGSQLVEIPEAGHLSNLESPQAFNRALEAFLSSL